MAFRSDKVLPLVFFLRCVILCVCLCVLGMVLKINTEHLHLESIALSEPVKFHQLFFWKKLGEQSYFTFLGNFYWCKKGVVNAHWDLSDLNNTFENTNIYTTNAFWHLSPILD